MAFLFKNQISQGLTRAIKSSNKLENLKLKERLNENLQKKLNVYYLKQSLQLGNKNFHVIYTLNSKR